MIPLKVRIYWHSNTAATHSLKSRLPTFHLMFFFKQKWLGAANIVFRSKELVWKGTGHRPCKYSSNAQPGDPFKWFFRCLSFGTLSENLINVLILIQATTRMQDCYMNVFLKLIHTLFLPSATVRTSNVQMGDNKLLYRVNCWQSKPSLSLHSLVNQMLPEHIRSKFVSLPKPFWWIADGALMDSVFGDYEKSIVLYQQALDVAPNHNLTLCNFGALLNDIKKDYKG